MREESDLDIEPEVLDVPEEAAVLLLPEDDPFPDIMSCVVRLVLKNITSCAMCLVRGNDRTFYVGGEVVRNCVERNSSFLDSTHDEKATFAF